MEYVYAAMLLHKAGKKVDEASVKKVLESAGVAADASRIKALVAALSNVDIDEAVKQAAPVAQAAAPAVQSASSEQPKAEKKHEEEKKSDEDAAAGLGALFG